MRQHGHGRPEPHSRHSRRSGNPGPLQCANTLMAAPNPTPAILAAAGIQSPHNAPTRSRPRRTPLLSFSPQRESRAHTICQHGHGRPKPHSRHSHRSGNPRPLQCANTVMAAPNLTPVMLAAAGIQGPYNAPTRSRPPQTPLPSFSPQRESRALTMRQHGHGRPKPHSRHCHRSGNPRPLQCANTVMAAPNLTPVILAAAGIQSPHNAPTPLCPPQTPLPSFSPQRESRAHTMRQHGHGRAEPHSRHSRRSGNPEPSQCANTVMAAPNPTAVILAAAGIQSPHNAPTPLCPPQTPLPSFSPQRESRALTMRQHGHGRPKPHSRHSRRSGNPEPLPCANTVMAAPNPTPVILAAAGIQSPYNASTRPWPPRTSVPSFSPQWESRALTMRQHGHGRAEPHCRHSGRSGNPEPSQCANTVMSAPNATAVILAAAGIQSPYNAPTRSRPRRTSVPQFSPQRESRALTMCQHGHCRTELHCR